MTDALAGYSTAIDAGAAALPDYFAIATPEFFTYEDVARAVLEAASTEIECPAHFHTRCDLCGGSSKLRVLLPDTPKETRAT